MSFEIRKINCEKAGESCTVALHSSGLKVYLAENPALSSSYAVFGTKYGSVDTEFSIGDGEMIKVPEGIAHFLEHKLFEGEDGDAFQKYAVTGASANAYTSFDRTCYLFSCSGSFYENLNILLSFVSSPYFTPETVQKEQGIIGQEIRMYEDIPGWRVLFNLFRALYHNHPVKIEIAGTVESIAQITDKTLYDCYNTFYNPSNMFICICGNFETDKVLDAIDQKIKTTDTHIINRSEFNEPDTIVTDFTEQKMAVSLPLFTVGIKDNSRKSSRSMKIIKATELLLEMCAGKISLLYNRLLEEGLINTRFSAEYFYGNGYSLLLFEGESSNPEAVKDAIISEINSIAQGNADAELFEDALRKLYGSDVRGYNDPEETVGVFIDCAMGGFEPYEKLDCLSKLKVCDVISRAKELDTKLTALSVINPID
ncbi:MAG: insulinase family protein [Clostridia bacterium]|nr:insulinase family protein [Clostridia bacterium]